MRKTNITRTIGGKTYMVTFARRWSGDEVKILVRGESSDVVIRTGRDAYANVRRAIWHKLGKKDWSYVSYRNKIILLEADGCNAYDGNYDEPLSRDELADMVADMVAKRIRANRLEFDDSDLSVGFPSIDDFLGEYFAPYCARTEQVLLVAAYLMLADRPMADLLSYADTKWSTWDEETNRAIIRSWREMAEAGLDIIRERAIARSWLDDGESFDVEKLREGAISIAIGCDLQLDRCGHEQMMTLAAYGLESGVTHANQSLAEAADEVLTSLVGAVVEAHCNQEDEMVDDMPDGAIIVSDLSDADAYQILDALGVTDDRAIRLVPDTPRLTSKRVQGRFAPYETHVITTRYGVEESGEIARIGEVSVTYDTLPYSGGSLVRVVTHHEQPIPSCV